MAKNSNFSCDTNTGICSPNKHINNETVSLINNTTTSNLKVIYYYDALCGWCYGFGPDLMRFQEEFKDKVEIEVISGGLFLGGRVGTIEEVAPYIKAGAYKSVESTTGVKFGDLFLNDVFGKGRIILNSLPPAIALCIVKEQLPGKGLAFAEMLLNAVYSDGINPVNVAEYQTYVSQIGLDFNVFSAKMKEDKYKEMAENEFQNFKNTTYRGMPTLVLEKDDQQVLLSSGYLGFNELKQKVAELIK